MGFTLLGAQITCKIVPESKDPTQIVRQNYLIPYTTTLALRCKDYSERLYLYKSLRYENYSERLYIYNIYNYVSFTILKPYTTQKARGRRYGYSPPAETNYFARPLGGGPAMALPWPCQAQFPLEY